MPDYLDFGQAHLYTGHNFGNGYSVRQGRYVIPIAEEEPTDPAELADWKPYVVVDVHAPIMSRTVTYNTKKAGGPPLVPAMEDAGDHEFLGGTTFVHHPRLNSDGWTHTWEVGGQYSYVVAGPVSTELENGLVLGSLPIPTNDQLNLNSTLGAQTVPAVGSIRQAGADAKSAYAEAQNLTLTSPYVYMSTALFPGVFFSPAIAKAETVNGIGTQPQPAFTQEAAVTLPTVPQ